MDMIERVGTATPPWLLLVGTTAVAYVVINSIYLLYFHPASMIPGPKLAAISYIPYCYHWMRGRFPWAVEEMHRKYGEVVRVGPNDIVFYTPKAAADIYGASVRGQEIFVKTDLMDFGAGDLGFIWESDPSKRKAVGKKILPAFSTKAVKDKEPIINTYIDLFVSKMKQLGGRPEGLNMNDWLFWLGVDMGADLAYSREMNHVRDGKTSDFVETLRGTSFVGMLIQLSKKLPAVTLLAPFCVPFKVLRAIPAAMEANKAEVRARIDKRGKTKHPDYVDYLVSPEEPPPSTEKEFTHIEQVALQMFVAGFDPLQITFYAALFFLNKHSEAYAILKQEIRDAFKSYEDITPDALAHLQYLQAFIHETLRSHLTAGNGHPRRSPGATVDGVYVPKGVVVLFNTLTAMRHERYFRDPLEFHPERWLPRDHPLYNARYVDDNLKAFFPFSLGPRQCVGKEIAWMQIRLFLGKVLWTFDLEGIRGQDKSFDKDFKIYAMWSRPELYLRFVPAKGRDTPPPPNGEAIGYDTR